MPPKPERERNAQMNVGNSTASKAAPDRPVRSANPHHQKMSVAEMRDAITALLSVSHTFSLQACLSSHVACIENLQEWAERHQDLVCFEIEDMVRELESRRGLSEDDENDRTLAIAYAYPLIRQGKYFDIVVERREGPHD
ncbi:hypothetical protein [Pelagibacterium halotolerans]|uniref:hypothetical protein n=1 Tax=Pelagibacterium halotolerans TaxID=531813 RepID=UPI0038510388